MVKRSTYSAERKERKKNGTVLTVSDKVLEVLQANFREGTEVRLERMCSADAPEIGTKGVVERVDSNGSLHVLWADGSRGTVVYSVDLVRITKRVTD